jgi:parallel beta-helix repeat protein
MRIFALVAVVLVLAAPTVAAAYDRLVNPFHSCSISGTPEYDTLQDAVNAANPGEQIGVCPGTYDQSSTVFVDTPGLTLTGIGSVLVNGLGQICLQIAADGITVRYFAIQNCSAAIDLVGTGALIQNNTLRLCEIGVFVEGPNNIVQSNLLEDNGIGAFTGGNTVGSAIKNNTVHRGTVGIALVASSAIVNKNSVQGASRFGILASLVSDSTISFNSVSFNTVGIELEDMGSGNQVTRNVVTRSPVIDCDWDGNGGVTFSRNTCGTENPPGAWD